MKSNTIMAAALVLCLSLAIQLHQAPSCLATVPSAATYEAYPPFLAATVPPLVMLVMGRDHKLYYEAYNDASDLDEDGTLDITYKPDDIDYYGYFDSHKYYEYSTVNNRFEPKGLTVNAGGVVDGIGKMAPSGNYWSGDFLNYVTMTRMDALRKVLYGGYRSTDTATDTVLERVFVPQDAHSWGKEYESIERDGYDIAHYTPLSKPVGATRHILANTTLSDGGPPLMRVLQNSVLRVWEWVAIERPVAGDQGDDGSGRRAVTDNGVGASAEYDETAGGSTGVITDNAASGSATYTDSFGDGSINSSLWTQVDKTNDAAATFSESSGQLNIDAGGHDIWTTTDEFASVFMNDLSGNFDIKVKVTAQENTNSWAKAGIIVRNDMNQPGTAAGAGYVVMARTPGNGYSFQYDNDANGFLDNHVTGGGSAAMPAWLRLVKEGTTFKGYYGTDGTNWTLHATRTIGSAATVQDVGLFVTSHSFGTKSLCKFDSFELTRSMGTDPSLAFDDNNSTAWMSLTEPTSVDPAWIQFAYYQPQRIVKYSLTTSSGSTDLDPDEWKLIATNDATAAAASSVDLADWVVVDTVEDGDLPATRGTAKSFVCDSPPAEGTTYKYYRLLITGSKSASTSGVALAEIQMMKTTDAIPATATLTDYHVRVQVCVAGMLESNSKKYPDGDYKPIGLLQRHGENNGMYFGLLSGSYTKNTSGGVLRKNIDSITDEINPDTGQLTSVNGIIKSINTFRIVDFDYDTYAYETNCGWVTTHAINEGQCRMWGNPIGEMMYETLRYFAGESSPTTAFTYADTNDNTPDSGTQLNLPKPAWSDPYATYPECSKPFMLVLSDINPSFDSDILPGSFFSGQAAETIGNADAELDAESLADDIYSEELSSAGNYFIGRQASTDDGACTEKSLDGFGDIRGLCPEEPTKQGTYYSASVAHYGRIKDLNSAAGEQQVRTYAVGLASPLPRFEIELEGKKIALVPFAKSVAGNSISAAQGDFQPTNTIVDMFIEELRPTYGKFRINYEDVEQGADHDMDAIITYEYQLVDDSGNPVDTLADATALDITLYSDYAAGGIVQHCGYIISGTTQDGTYLEVRDEDTATGSDPDYFMDTPPGVWASDSAAAREDGLPLPLNTTRRFVVDTGGGTLAAKLLTNPLWYAAKWGGFEDKNHNDLPDQQSEWDKDGDGVPDTYFYVVNPLRLEEQLNKSFADIAEKAASSTAASVLATNSKGEGNLIQAYFRPQKTFLGGELKWIGYLQSLWLDPWGNLREDSNGNQKLDLTNAATSLTVDAIEAEVDRIVTFITDGNGNTRIRRFLKHYRYHPNNGNANYCTLEQLPSPVTCPDLSVDADGNPNDAQVSEDIELYDIDPVFEAGDRLLDRSADSRKIFTFIDGDGEDNEADGSIDQSGEEEIPGSKWVGRVSDPMNDDPFNSAGEIIPFTTANAAMIKPFLGLRDNSAWSYLDDSSAAPSHATRVNNLIEYIRGKDSADLTGSPKARSRTIDGKVWKLGDIVNSTPVSISKPPDNFHIIYHDKSYQTYYDHFKSRETVIYVGANDGMLHAFTSWIYNDSIKGYTQKASTTELLGDELWAYIPQSLLPHLKWLADPDYAHTYYVDLKPRIFDAKILPDEAHYTDSDAEKNWGTFMIMGLNMGGKHISVDEDLDTDPATFETRDFYPTYACLDITDPRNPRVLWERSYPGLGMTTSYPAVAQVGRSFDSANHKWNDDGQWVAIFGSGPNDASASSDYSGYSDQNGKVFVVDLLTGQLQRTFDTGEANAFMNAPVAFDKDLTYNVDAIYLGSTSWNGSAWRGKAYKINTRGASSPTPVTNTANWTFSAMFDAERPITAPLALSIDLYDNVWAYFGTGRYIGMVDKTNSDQQYFFGLKDPDFNNGLKNATLLKANLLDANAFKVYAGGTVDSSVSSRTDINNWNTLLKMTRNKEDQTPQPDIYDGWYRSLEHTASVPSERVISKASVLGGIVFFPGYTPNDDICGYGGDTNFYGVYYETGTAYKKHILPGDVTIETVGTENLEVVNYKINIGQGAPPPSAGFHVGREEGATSYLQMSTGEVVEINVDTALPIKSGIAGWREQN